MDALPLRRDGRMRACLRIACYVCAVSSCKKQGNKKGSGVKHTAVHSFDPADTRESNPFMYDGKHAVSYGL